MLYTAKAVGYIVYLDKSYPDSALLCETSFFNRRTKKSMKTYAPIFIKDKDTKDKIIGMGAFRLIYKEAPLLFTLHSTSTNFDPIFEGPYPEGLTLRPYQQECLSTMFDHKGGVIRLPTGTGKGTIEVAYAHQVLSSGHVVLLVPTQPVLETMIARCQQYKIPYCTYYESREKMLTESTVIITKPGTLSNDSKSGANYYNRSQVTTVIADECHHLSCKTWSSIFTGLPNVQRSFGFSATLSESSDTINKMTFDNAMMVSYTGPVIYSRKASDSAIAPYIDIPNIYEIEYEWEKEIETNKWEELAVLIKDNKDRQKFIASIVNEVVACGYTCLSVVARRESVADQHSFTDHESVQWYGGGELKTKSVKVEGNNALQFVKDNLGGSIKSIIATNHINEGADIPILDVVILSENVHPKIVIQRAGRTVRLGGKKSIVINIMDANGGVLKNHSHKRRTYLQSEFNVKSTRIKLDYLKAILK